MVLFEFYMDFEGIEVRWLGHASFILKDKEKDRTIYIDPYDLSENPNLDKADMILITHSHYDHCSFADLQKVVKEGTIILATADCQSTINKLENPVKVEIVHPGMELDFNGLRILTVPAYNIDKSFHPKEEGWVGYVIKMNGLVLYHPGDTDVIPEMKNLTGHKQQGKTFVALLPIGGRFTMTAEEAVEAAKMIKPSITIPMHWGSIIGTEEDAKEFLELCKEEGIKCEILEKK